MQNKKNVRSLVALAVLASTFAFYVAPICAAAQTEAVIHSFQANGRLDGSSPHSSLIADAQGALYGFTDSGGKYKAGSVFKLVPPVVVGGAWTEDLLYSFTGSVDGSYPLFGSLLLRNGKLYGATVYGGLSGDGVIFQLTPGKPWQEAVLYSFPGGVKGRNPYSGVVVGYGGSLYGTTSGGGAYDSGVVFRLSPSGSGGPWTESVVYSFKGGNTDGYFPVFGMAVDASGALYGTTNNGGPANAGVVFQLTPTANGPWTETVLYFFQDLTDGYQPTSPLVFDVAGALYGTTNEAGDTGCTLGYGCGSVFQLVPPAVLGGAWTENTLHDFTGGPGDGALGYGVTVDNTGALYGVTGQGGSYISVCSGGCGSIFKLTPPSAPGGSWTDQTEYSFADGTDGFYPIAPMVLVGGTFYGTTDLGGSKSQGTVFSFTP